MLRLTGRLKSLAASSALILIAASPSYPKLAKARCGLAKLDEKQPAAISSCRMDADCLPEKDWLSRGAAHFKDNRVVLVSGPYDYHDASPLFRFTSLAFQKIVYVPVNHLLRISKRGAIALGGNTFLRREALDKMGGFDTSIAFYGDDMDTAKRASLHGKTVFDGHLVMKTADPSKDRPSRDRFGGRSLPGMVARYWYHFFKAVMTRRKRKSA